MATYEVVLLGSAWAVPRPVLIVMLAPGTYSAQVTGVALVEIYELP